MSSIQESIFKTVFNKSSAPSVILKADAPHFTILFNNDQHKIATNTVGQDITGKGILEMFNPEDEGRQTEYNVLLKGLYRALQENGTIKLPVLRYDILADDGINFKPSWWQVEIMPISANGEVEYLMITSYDKTQQQLTRHAIEAIRNKEDELHEELAATGEELTTANEEVSVINEELRQSQRNLLDLNNQLENRIYTRTNELKVAQAEAKRQSDRLHRFFMQAPAAICILDGKNLVFELVNPAYQQLFPGRELLGRSVFDAIPEIIGQPIADILHDVYNTGKPFEGKELLIPLAYTDGGPVIDRYFNFIYQARLDAYNQVDGILVFGIEITDTVRSKHKIAENESSLRHLVMNAPYALMILRGPEFKIEMANQQIANMWDKPLDQITGYTLLEVLPEIADQPFPALLNQVYTTATSHAQEEEVFHLDSPNGPIKKYVSFFYDPMFDNEGNVCGIIVAAEDITEKVEVRKSLEQSYEEHQALIEEVKATNEELAASNEELATINKELAEIQENLESMVINLAESESRIRYMIADAPVAIAIFTGRELLVESANNKVLKIWGKDNSIIGKPLYIALPELAGQPFLQILDDVFTSGQPFYGNEVKALLEQDGNLVEVYTNFIYKPIKDHQGATISIMVVANEITEQVVARKELQRAEEMLRFSIEAGKAGTWYIDIKTREFIPSSRMKELYGFNPDEELTIDALVECIPEEYRERAVTLVEASVTKGENYEFEHPLIGHHNQKLRWVRAVGRAYADSDGNLSHFSGLMIDITEQKQDEIRKNDFIGMVSHELKTPLTSLSAYVQLLHSKAKKSNDTFTADALGKVNHQVKKMSTLINSFLNVSRLESGKIHLEKQEFNLNELIKDMIEETKMTIATHAIHFFPCQPIPLLADQDKIGSVISNLLSNAVKYSPKGKTIQVKCELIDNMAQVSVKDEGMGIKPQDIEKLFERYYRVESKHTQTISGFGIGLYLTAEIVERHGGKIWVESEVGVGSTFYFTLPLE